MAATIGRLAQTNWKSVSADQFMNMNGINYGMPSQQDQALSMLGTTLGAGLGLYLANGCSFKGTGRGGVQQAPAAQTQTVDSNADLSKQIEAQEKVVATAQTNYDDAVKAWDDENKEINDNITTAKSNVETYEKAEKSYKENVQTITNYRNKAQSLRDQIVTTAPAGETDEQKAAREKQNEELERQAQELEEEANTLETKNDTEFKPQADKLPAAKEELRKLEVKRENLVSETPAVKTAKATLDTETEKLNQLKAQIGMDQTLDNCKGNWLKRQTDGKDSIEDRVNAYQKAKAKYLEKGIGALDADDIAALQGASQLADDIEAGSNQTNSYRALVGQLRSWSSTHSSELDQLGRLTQAEGSGLPTVDDIEKTGYYKQQSRQVTHNGKTVTMTVYNGKGDNDSYIIENGKVIKLNYTQSGNLFHKAQYSY